MSEPIRPSKFAHIVLRTRRYEEMIQWWSTFLGAFVRMKTDYLAFLSYDEEHHRIAIIGLPHLAEATPDAIGLDHFAYSFATLDDLFGKYDEMCAIGSPPYWTINHGMTLSAYYRDPDGNQVETQIDSMSMVDADTLMRSQSFFDNPIGVNVDFAELIARHRAGAPASEIFDPNTAAIR
jgi:catechol-2,3-dioxygenase